MYKIFRLIPLVYIRGEGGRGGREGREGGRTRCKSE